MVQSKLSNADTKGRRQYDKIFSRGVGSRLFTRVGTVPVLIRFLTLGPVRPLMNAAISGSSPALPLHTKTIGKNKMKNKLKKEKRKSDGFL
jgi:hypothetical protein